MLKNGKKVVYIGDFKPLALGLEVVKGDSRGFVERHIEVEFRFESAWAWLLYRAQLGCVPRWANSVHSVDLSVDGTSMSRSCNAGKLHKTGDGIGYKIGAWRVARDGGRNGNALHCQHCDWSGSTLNLMPKRCILTQKVRQISEEGDVTYVPFEREFDNHLVNYTVELVDSFGIKLSQKVLDAVFHHYQETVVLPQRKASYDACLVDEGWPDGEYVYGVRDRNQPSNRCVKNRERCGGAGEFLRKYPHLEVYQYYRYRGQRHVYQELRAIDACELDDDAPKVRAKRGKRVIKHVSYSDGYIHLSRSWKEMKKRKQWV